MAGSLVRKMTGGSVSVSDAPEGTGGSLASPPVSSDSEETKTGVGLADCGGLRRAPSFGAIFFPDLLIRELPKDDIGLR